MTDDSTTPGVDRPSRVRRWSRGWLVVAAILGIGAVIAVVSLRGFGPENSYRRGRQAILRGDYDTARRESELLIRTTGYETQGWLLKGLILARIGKPDEAVASLEKASTNPLLTVDAGSAAARCFYETGKYLQCINAAEAALALDKNCLDARRMLASAYYDLGAISNAIDELDQISQAAPTDPRPARLLGLIGKDSEQFLDAIGYYRESLKRDPRQPDRQAILAELAECQIKVKQFEEALQTLKDCERSAEILTLEADCFGGLGKTPEAVERLEQALKLDPRYFRAKLALGKQLMDLGKTEQAVHALEEAVQIAPQISQGYFQLSQALRRMELVERADEALRTMQQIQALEREFSDLHDKASKNPNDAEVRFRLGELATELGKPLLARVWFRAALAINPRHAKARSAVEQLDSPTGPASSARP